MHYGIGLQVQTNQAKHQASWLLGSVENEQVEEESSDDDDTPHTGLVAALPYLLWRSPAQHRCVGAGKPSGALHLVRCLFLRHRNLRI